MGCELVVTIDLVLGRLSVVVKICTPNIQVCTQTPEQDLMYFNAATQRCDFTSCRKKLARLILGEAYVAN